MTNGVKKASLKYKGHVPSIHVDASAFAGAKKKYGDYSKAAELIEQLVSDGYTVKITPSNDGSRVYFELGGTNIAPDNARGRYLSSFGGSLLSAVAVAAYRHIDCYEEHWPADEDIEYG